MWGELEQEERGNQLCINYSFQLICPAFYKRKGKGKINLMLQKEKYNSSETNMSQYLFNNYWKSKKSRIKKYNQPTDSRRIPMFKNVAIMSVYVL